MKLNYFMFEQFSPGEYLLTNELGQFCFVDESDFKKLTEERYTDIREDTLSELKEKCFVFEEAEVLFTNRVLQEYRNTKQYIFTGTCLHIIVLTNRCNLNCVYCQAQDAEQQSKGLMDLQTAEKTVDIILQSPAHSLNIEFQGGEPLLNFDVIKHIVEYADSRKNDKNLTYSVVTNTIALTDEMIDFFLGHNISVSTSLDGDVQLHNKNRPYRDGTGSFSRVVNNIKRLKEKGLDVGAIQTTTRASLDRGSQIVDAYLEAGLDTLFIRPLTPLGYAKGNWDAIGYKPEEFLQFYRETLSYIIKANLQGKNIKEGHAILFLSKILRSNFGNYMELRSPCGAGIGQMAYYYDGDIYTCDEARMLGEMGNDIFKVGNVNIDSYQSIMDNKSTKITCQASVLEALPQCCDCVYHPYCGVCPVVNLAVGGNIYAREANTYRCRIYKGMLDILFELIRKNGNELKIFRRWIYGEV